MPVVRQPLDGSPIIFDIVNPATVVTPGTTHTWSVGLTATYGTGFAPPPLTRAGGYDLPTEVYVSTPNAGGSWDQYADAIVEAGHAATEILFRESGDFKIVVMGLRPLAAAQQIWIALGSLTTAGTIAFSGGFAVNNLWNVDSDNALGAFNIVEPGIVPFYATPRQDGVVASRVMIFKDSTPSLTDAQVLELFNSPLSQIVDAPEVGANGVYESIAANDADAELPLDAVLAAGAPPEMTPYAGQQAILLNPGPSQLNADGTFTNNASNDHLVQVKAWDTLLGATGAFGPAFPILIPGTGAALAPLTISEPIYATGTFQATTTIDLTGIANPVLEINGSTVAGTLTQANPGVVSFGFPEGKLGLELGPNATIRLCDGEEHLAQGTEDLIARTALIDPVTAGEVTQFPESQYVDDDGDTIIVDQIETYNSGATYSVLVNGQWNGPFDAAIPLELEGDSIETPTGNEANYTGSALTTVTPEGAAKIVDGCVSESATGTIFYEWFNEPLTKPLKDAGIRVRAPLENNNAAPVLGNSASGWSMAALHGAGGTLTLTAIGPGASPVMLGCIGVVLDAPLSDPSLIYVRTRPNGPTGTEWQVWVGDKLVIPSQDLVDAGFAWQYDTYFPAEAVDFVVDRGGALGSDENVGETCYDQLSVSGHQVVATIASYPVSAVHGQPFPIDWTKDNFAENWTVTDERGNSIPQVAVATGSAQETIPALDLTGLWKGNLVVTDPEGNEAYTVYSAAAGLQFKNLAATLSPAGVLMGFAPSGQLTLPTHTLDGDAITVQEDGTIEIASTNLPQYIDVAVHDRTQYQQAVRHWFFEEIAATSSPEANIAFGEPVSLSLQDYFNSPLDVPVDQVGASGQSYVVTTALPDGLSRTGLEITGNLTPGNHTIGVSIVDQAGNPPLVVQWDFVVGSPQIALQTVGESTVSAVLSPIEGSPTVDFFLAVVPVGQVLTAQQIELGRQSDDITPALGFAGATGVVTNVPRALAVSGLTGGESFQVYAAAKDAAGNYFVANLGEIQTTVIPDTSPPMFTASPTATDLTVGTTAISVTVTATDNESATIDYYLAVSESTDQPLPENIIAGVQSDGLTPLIARGLVSDIASGASVALTVAGLSASSDYRVSIVAVDESGNAAIVALGLQRTMDVVTQTQDDTEPPFWTDNPVVHEVSPTSISVRATALDDGALKLNYHYIESSLGDTPSPENILAGVQSDGVTPLLSKVTLPDVARGLPVTIPVSGYTADSPHQLFFAVDDGTNLISWALGVVRTSKPEAAPPALNRFNFRDAGECKHPEWLPFILPFIDGVPERMVFQRLNEVLIDFCQETRLWTYHAQALDINKGQEVYEVPLPDHTAVVRSESVRVGGFLLGPTDSDRPLRMRSGNSYIRSENRLFIQPEPKEFREDALEVIFSLKPTFSAMTCQQQFFTDWREYIVAGVLAKLYMMGAEPWADPVMASEYAKAFKLGKNKGFAKFLANQDGMPHRASGDAVIRRDRGRQVDFF